MGVITLTVHTLKRDNSSIRHLWLQKGGVKGFAWIQIGDDGGVMQSCERYGSILYDGQRRLREANERGWLTIKTEEMKDTDDELAFSKFFNHELDVSRAKPEYAKDIHFALRSVGLSVSSYTYTTWGKWE